MQAKKLVESLLFLLQKPTHLLKVDDIISSASPLSTSGAPGSSKMRIVADGSAGKAEDYSLGGLAEKFIWECPENLPERLSQAALPLKRKISTLEGSNRRPRGDNSPGETVGQNTFSRGSGPPTVPVGPTRRDTFRQRKPNTSRPPSMHVDDYVARERSVDVTSSSNVIAVPRIGSSSGRPPSIHVDEFMARQRERQNLVGQVVGDSTQVKNTPAESNASAEKSNSKPRQLKPDLDDDLQGIDIVFDGEESESDDKLPFPQPDDNLLPPPESVVVEQNSPRSIVEETENDINGSNQFSHLGDENIQGEFSSRMSVTRPELALTREPSISSERKYYEASDGTKHTPLSSSGFSPSMYNRTAGQSVQSPFNSRVPPNLSSKNSPQQTGAGQGVYDRNFQPPLPPMPPPATISPSQSKTADTAPSQSAPFVNAGTDGQGPPPPGFHVG